MCNLIRIDLATNWEEELLNHSKRIKNFQVRSEIESYIITFEYPDKNTVIRINENLIFQNRIRKIVKYDDNGRPVSSESFLYCDNEWLKFEENQYSYNSDENIKYCIRTRFPKNGNKIIEKSEIQTLKSENSLKEIITYKGTNHQSIEEFEYDNYGREIEFKMYEIYNGEQMNVLKTTNEFNGNIEIHSLFSTKSKESNEWSLISKTVTESSPDEITQITEYFENEKLTLKEKQIKYLNDSKQITKILNYDMIENKWELIEKFKYDYANKYLKTATILNFVDNSFVPTRKTEYENLDGFITKKICFAEADRNWVKTSEQLYEYF